MTTKAELKDLVEQSVAYVHKVLIEERQKELMPIFHLVAPPGGQSAVVGTPWNSKFEKQLAVAQVKAMARSIDAQAVVFTTECWLVKRDTPTDWHRQRIHNVIPSQEPDRMEAVMIAAKNKARDTEVVTLQIIRDKPGGRIISLIREVEFPGIYESWMFDGMFNPTED